MDVSERLLAYCVLWAGTYYWPFEEYTHGGGTEWVRNGYGIVFAEETGLPKRRSSVGKGSERSGDWAGVLSRWVYFACMCRGYYALFHSTQKNNRI